MTFHLPACNVVTVLIVLCRALYVYSSSPNAGENPVTLKPNDTNTEHSPVYLTSLLIDSVDQAEAGKNIQTNVNSWRSQSRSVGGFVVRILPLIYSIFNFCFTPTI